MSSFYATWNCACSLNGSDYPYAIDTPIQRLPNIIRKQLHYLGKDALDRGMFWRHGDGYYTWVGEKEEKISRGWLSGRVWRAGDLLGYRKEEVRCELWKRIDIMKHQRDVVWGEDGTWEDQGEELGPYQIIQGWEGEGGYD